MVELSCIWSFAKLLYIVYLDEFGHIGPFISHDHPTHKTHPIFGLGGDESACCQNQLNFSELLT